MFKYSFIYVIILAVGSLWSCTDPIEFDTEPNLGNMIVEGLITDAPGVQRVKLSRTGQFTNIFDGGIERPVTSALVRITDDQGNEHLLTEIAGGIYLTDSMDFQGQLGRTYILHIETSDRNEYESTPETLLKQASFDNISTEFKEIQVLNNHNAVVTAEGTEVFVDMTFLEPRNVFLRYSWRYAIDKRVFFDIDYINVVESNNFSTDKVNDLSILFLDKAFGSDLQEIRMEVFQYTLSKNVFDFWDAAAKQRNNGGSIFDAPPARIGGNIVNINNPDEVVIGVFSAAGVNKQEIRFRQ